MLATVSAMPLLLDVSESTVIMGANEELSPSHRCDHLSSGHPGSC